MATKILVVEDERNILENIVETLEIEGFEVRGTESGRASVEIAQQYRPNLILCDIMMPEFDGYDVLMSVRNDTSLATTPFIFLTALAARAQMRHGMEMGADDYLTKPFTPTELLAAVNTRLEKHGRIVEENNKKMATLRDNIVYALPHELRTPLTGLIGCADFLVMDYQEIDRENLLNIAQVMMRSAVRLERVVENYLLYAQIEIAAIEPERVIAMRGEVVNYPHMLVEETAIMLGKHAEREADLKIDVEEGMVAISHNNFKKVIHELVDNALKFSKTGQDVVICTRAEASNYVITIKDLGRGMTLDEIHKIGAYVQFNRKLYEQQGLGLGLVIAQRLIEMHGGTLDIQSTLGEGTTMTITLPQITD